MTTLWAPLSWPNKQIASLEALLLSNSLICSGVIRASKSSFIFSQWRLERCSQYDEDHRVPLSLRAITFSFKIGTPVAPVKENEKKWRSLFKYDWMVLGVYVLLVFPSRNLSFRRCSSNSDSNSCFSSIAFKTLKTCLVCCRLVF